MIQEEKNIDHPKEKTVSLYIYIEWLLFNVKWSIFSSIMWRTRYVLMKWWWWCSLCTRSRHIVGFVYSVNSLKQSPGVDMLLHSDTPILILRQPVFALSHCYVLIGEKANTNITFIVFGTGMTGSGLRPLSGRARSPVHNRCGSAIFEDCLNIKYTYIKYIHIHFSRFDIDNFIHVSRLFFSFWKH